MNVLMLNYEFPPIGGGAGNAHLCILNEYANTPGLKIDALVSAPKPGFYTEQLSENINIYKVGVHKKNLHFWRKIEVIEWLFKAKKYYKKLIRKNNYDLIHSFFAFPSAYLCYKDAKKIPFIISLRGSDVPGANVRLQRDYKILAPLFKSIWKSSAAIVANSKGLKNRALKFMPKIDISVICNGVDTGKFKTDQNNGLSDEVNLITVGRLSQTKRVDMLINAVEILKNDGVQVNLKIIGTGALEDWLRGIALDKGLADCIKLTGRIETQQMPKLYSQADIYISASMQEGMSNSMLEAMACGLPIVTTNCEGLEELIKDNGIIVSDDNAFAIADAVKKLLNDKTMYISMAESATKRADNFSWQKTAQSYLKIYEEILSRNV